MLIDYNFFYNFWLGNIFKAENVIKNMKKLILFLILGILLVSSMGFVIAENGNGKGNGAQIQAVSDDSELDLEQDVSRGERGLGQRIRAGDYDIDGKKLMIQEIRENKIQLRVRNISADCDCNLTEEFDLVQNRTRLRMALSNGRNAEIKIMPDTASENALARLRLKVCSAENNCSIELKEVGRGEGNKTRAVYEIQIQRHHKLLGMFRIKAQNRVQVDAETGEIINVKKPWWAFLATDVEEVEEETE